jgi:thiol-disulfide isomerase/thioredoxin
VTYSLAMRFVVLALALVVACQQQQATTNTSKLELVDAPPTPAGGTAATWIAGEVTRAQHDGKQLVVYVGASWCEPCQQFHAAAAAGTLDAAFPALRMLVFDNDRDSEALESANYHSQLIPLFALPGPDGKSTGKQIEGSVKGADAVKQISPRLEALLRGAG